MGTDSARFEHAPTIGIGGGRSTPPAWGMPYPPCVHGGARRRETCSGGKCARTIATEKSRTNTTTCRCPNCRKPTCQEYANEQQTDQTLAAIVAENETLVKRLADIAAVNVTLEFRVIDLEKEITELRKENDHKFAAMCRLREEIARRRDGWDDDILPIKEL